VRSDGRPVLHFTAGDAVVFETPWAGSVANTPYFARTIAVGPHRRTLSLLVAEDRLEYRDHVGFDGRYPTPGSKEAYLGRIAATVDGLAGAPRWRYLTGNRLALELAPSGRPEVFTVMAGRTPPDARGTWRPVGNPAATRTLASLAAAPAPRKAAVKFTPLFAERTTTKGVLGANVGPYVVDSIPMPEANPWKSWMRPSGFDFFADGTTAAVCTWSGDVWLVSGLSGTLESVVWRRIASGLFQPLGLKIVSEKIHVLCRDQIVRLDDFDGDGEPDEVTCFNNEMSVTPNFHEFALDLQADSKGNFYFTKGGPLLGTDYWDPIGAHNGCVVRVSADGSKLDRYATGLRAPNGSGMSPDDQLVCSDNEGIWTPVCRLNWVKPGGFYGAMGMDHRETPPTQTDPPLCWLPYAMDNSSGSQVWADKKFGPLGGELIHLSYGKCRAFHVLTQEVRGVIQGGVTPLPWRFNSSAMRGRANPADGSLWVAGLKGWQTTAPNDGALHRIRWTGGKFAALAGFKVRHAGFDLTFTEPLDRATALQTDNWNLQQWNYSWSSQYGSDLYSVEKPGTKTGRKGELKGDALNVNSVWLSEDGRTVRLEIESVRPVMQLAVKASLVTKSGDPLKIEYFGTINAVP
jgi:hypothetical protein